MAAQPAPDAGPSLWAHLSASLDVYRDEHEGEFSPPETPQEERLHAAMNSLQSHALRLLATSRVPPELVEDLAAFEPGAGVEHKLQELLQINLVQHRLEFDVAEEVVSRLHRLPDRVRRAILAFLLLLRAAPSEIAVKYLERAVTLFLAGYTTEVFIMCGAVLEAAMAARYPDDELRRAGLRPAYKRTGVYSLGQRMAYEEQQSLLTSKQRDLFWEVVNWRNDAVHVHPDLGPAPELAVLFTASLLPTILPRPVP